MMGVIKAKNSAGEWVNVASAEATTITNELMGDLKMATEVFTWGNRSNSIDLSKYVGANDNFILILSIAQYADTSSVGYFAWHKNEGINVLRPHRQYPTAASIEGLFNSTTMTTSVSYDENTQIFALDDDTYKYIYSFTIVYAGVKEA